MSTVQSTPVQYSSQESPDCNEHQPNEFQQGLINQVRLLYANRINRKYQIGEQMIIAAAKQPELKDKELKEKSVKDLSEGLTMLTEEIYRIEQDREHLVGYIMTYCK